MTYFPTRDAYLSGVNIFGGEEANEWDRGRTRGLLSAVQSKPSLLVFKLIRCYINSRILSVFPATELVLVGFQLYRDQCKAEGTYPHGDARMNRRKNARDLFFPKGHKALECRKSERILTGSGIFARLLLPALDVPSWNARCWGFGEVPIANLAEATPLTL